MYRKLRKKLLVRKVTGCLKLLEKKKLLSVWRIQAAVQGFFTVKQGVQENILGCAWKLPSVSLKLCGTVNWIRNVLPVPGFFKVTTSKTVPAGNYQYRLTGLEEFQFMGCRACSQKQRCQKRDKVSLFWVS